MGIRQASPFVVGQFINDKLAFTLGIVRLIACLFIICGFRRSEVLDRALKLSTEFDKEVVQVIPIQILEFLMMLVAIQPTATVAP